MDVCFEFFPLGVEFTSSSTRRLPSRRGELFHGDSQLSERNCEHDARRHGTVSTFFRAQASLSESSRHGLADVIFPYHSVLGKLPVFPCTASIFICFLLVMWAEDVQAARGVRPLHCLPVDDVKPSTGSSPECINVTTSSANCTPNAQVRCGIMIPHLLLTSSPADRLGDSVLLVRPYSYFAIFPPHPSNRAGLPHQIPISASLSVSLPSSTSSHSSSSHSPPPVAVALGVLGGLLGLVAVALLVLFVRRRSMATPKQEQDKIEFRARTPHTQDPDVPPDPHRPHSPSGSSVAHQAPTTVIY
jgi:hypothetical protein